MSPRLDELRTEDTTETASSTPLSETTLAEAALTEAVLSEAALPEQSRTTHSPQITSESSAPDTAGIPELDGLPEIPPYTEVGPVDARPCPRRSSSAWSRWKKAPTNSRTSATPWSNSTSRW